VASQGVASQHSSPLKLQDVPPPLLLLLYQPPLQEPCAADS
jgi:hypothetical protein